MRPYATPPSACLDTREGMSVMCSPCASVRLFRPISMGESLALNGSYSISLTVLT
jgi:hypothetical protein